MPFKDKEKIRLKNKKYRETHKEYYKEYHKKWSEKNPEKQLEYNKRYLKKYPIKRKEIDGKKHHKRRDLDFIPLNEWFENSHAHHINKKYVAYIPKSLHQSIQHSQNDIESMIKINEAVMKWLKKQNKNSITKMNVIGSIPIEDVKE